MPTEVERLDKKYRELRDELEQEATEFNSIRAQYDRKVNRIATELSRIFFDLQNAKVLERKLSGGDK